VIRAARTAAKRGNLKFRAKEQDVFPATENDAACAEKILKACGGSLLPVPMRWSEDFGHYLLKCRGAYFGIGAGETCAPLHTEGYAYPEELLHLTADAFMKIILSSAVIQQTGNLSSLHA
jgi:metal-dependent amidase/aminoacylase/carboxypeptidase family protein